MKIFLCLCHGDITEPLLFLEFCGRCLRRIQKAETLSRKFLIDRKRASVSLMWATSRNLRPPNFTNGILRLVNSIRAACCAMGSPSSLASPPQADWRRCVGVAAVFATNRTSSLASATKVALQRPTSHRNEERSQVPRAQNQDAPTKRQFAMWKGGQTAKTCIGCLAAASVPRRRPARRQFCLR
jgi:hypothetical protein